MTGKSICPGKQSFFTERKVYALIFGFVLPSSLREPFWGSRFNSASISVSQPQYLPLRPEKTESMLSGAKVMEACSMKNRGEITHGREPMENTLSDAREDPAV